MSIESGNPKNNMGKFGKSLIKIISEMPQFSIDRIGIITPSYQISQNKTNKIADIISPNNSKGK